MPVVDLDKVAREVVEPGERTLARLAAHFGPHILGADGRLDRAALAQEAFASPAGRRALNEITHGAIRRRALGRVLRLWLSGAQVVVVDTPLLVEAGLWRLCGQAVLVYATASAQRRRLLARDAQQGRTGAGAERDADNRLASQAPLDSKRAYADVVLDNSHDAPGDSAGAAPTELRTQVDALVASWRATYSGIGWLRWALAWVVPPVGLVLAAAAVVRRSVTVGRKVRAERAEAGARRE